MGELISLEEYKKNKNPTPEPSIPSEEYAEIIAMLEDLGIEDPESSIIVYLIQEPHSTPTLQLVPEDEETD